MGLMFWARVIFTIAIFILISMMSVKIIYAYEKGATNLLIVRCTILLMYSLIILSIW